MIRYLDVGAVTALIQKIGLEESMAAMAAYIVDDYRRWHEFSKSPRQAHQAALGVLELMPIGDQKLYAFKYVNGHPQNTAKGLTSVMAFGMLAEVATGLPLLLSEMTLTTALRTAATSAIAARMMAREDSRIMAVIGCGAQSEFQILAFKSIMGIGTFRIYDIDPGAMLKVQNNLAGYAGVEIVAATSVREAVSGADIVTTVTADKANAAILTLDMIRGGAHINAVGGDCPGKTELHPDLIRAGRVVVEYEQQTRVEGDIQQMDADFRVSELWRVLTEAEPGRQNENQITIFDSVGFALEDFSALRYLNDRAVEHEAGSMINLVPHLHDPKDLFSLLHTVPMPAIPAQKVGVVLERK